ncbi:MAG TPA: hypothetical protein VD907_01580 [Verrucomicrobiae bacterium]|nr:hypothetical protein [Verrucomicrobiae bacterium]
MFDAIKEWVQNLFGEQIQQTVEDTVQNVTEQAQDIPGQVTEQVEQVTQTAEEAKQHIPGQ